MSSLDNNDAPISNAFFAVYQQSLRKRLQFFVDGLHSILRNDVLRALGEPGKLLDQSGSEASSPSRIAGMWALVTLLVALDISPDIEQQACEQIAIAVESFICALDLLDDVEDGDVTPLIQELGIGRVLNVSTTLVILAQRMIVSLAQYGVSSTLIARLLTTLQDAALVATGGQHQDLLAEYEAVEEFTPELCIKIAEEKAGALMRLPFQIAALYAKADEKTYQLFTELGRLLGITAQLDNDSHDLYHLLQNNSVAASGLDVQGQTPFLKTDLSRRKKTLPIVLAAKQDSADESSLRNGILASWGICLLYRERTLECIREIEEVRPLSPALRFILGF